jgi:osmotically-inducible protein OsmY
MQLNLKNMVFALMVGVGLAVAAVGCHTEGRSTGTYIDDRMVTSKVKGALSDSAVYKFPNVDVSTFNGTVQLNGFVDTSAQKQQAAALASQVQGVRQLINNITVQPAPGQYPTGRNQGQTYPK